jgi:hypothetical protein
MVISLKAMMKSLFFDRFGQLKKKITPKLLIIFPLIPSPGQPMAPVPKRKKHPALHGQVPGKLHEKSPKSAMIISSGQGPSQKPNL